MSGGRYHLLHASEVATQPLPLYFSLNYADLFKIQRVGNPFQTRWDVLGYVLEARPMDREKSILVYA